MRRLVEDHIQLVDFQLDTRTLRVGDHPRRHQLLDGGICRRAVRAQRTDLVLHHGLLGVHRDPREALGRWAVAIQIGQGLLLLGPQQLHGAGPGQPRLHLRGGAAGLGPCLGHHEASHRLDLAGAQLAQNLRGARGEEVHRVLLDLGVALAMDVDFSDGRLELDGQAGTQCRGRHHQRQQQDLSAAPAETLRRCQGLALREFHQGRALIIRLHSPRRHPVEIRGGT
mmetsp:Transcript_111065/g.265106  ORF Transcript_111065/g.265106 Transcript_111065/m.265106 type:complete len:226 (+) Transcript_111065:1788-2465(+)